MQPAHQTKHQSIIEISFLPELTFHLSQKNQSENNSSTGTTGTTLWLGAQCLSAYIAQYHKPPQNQQTTTAIELGSGVGLSSLVLSALGYSTVFATDTELVINSVLSRNMESNLSVIAAGRAILVRELDWHVPPGHWNWDNPRAIASRTMQSTGGKNDLPTPFDLIITSDTVYEESLVEPLLRTLHALSLQSLAASKLASLSQSLPSESPPLVLLCLERRDPSFIDHVLASARDKWCFSTEQVPKRKLAKVMQRHVGGRRKWDSNRAEWEGVEIWKLQLGSTS